MIRLRTIAFLVLAFSIGVSGTQRAMPAAAVAGVSQERLKRLDAVLQEHVDQNRIAGIVALVLRDGKPIYERALGWSDKDAKRPMTVDTIFRIASQSKALTSAAILQLMEEGRLTPNMPVSRFIPEYAKTTVALKGDAGVSTVDARRAITIADLLTHTAGISYGTDATVADQYKEKGLGPAAGYGWYTADKDEEICATMERLAGLPFVAQPGESYVYGYNTDILGCVVERASGMPLDRFIAERITGPLKMKDTRFFLPAGERNRLATVYASEPEGTIVRAPEGARGQGHYVDGPRRSFSGGAGLVSTARDYARFLEMTRQGGTLDGVRVLSPRSVALMATNQSGTLHSANGLGFGFGFQTVERYGAMGLSSVGAYRWGGAYGSNYLVDPDARLVLVYMIQQIPNRTDLGQVIPALVYQALTDPPRTK
ncbi:MAG TPA: serine hydrolase domain-containing protein [Vicinamibacterales bacterium]|nr:serine hydrolase domain-containing protein [Vicinamibacterales bacterium]